jgi:hypothetical protein
MREEGKRKFIQNILELAQIYFFQSLDSLGIKISNSINILNLGTSEIPDAQDK